MQKKKDRYKALYLDWDDCILFNYINILKAWPPHAFNSFLSGTEKLSWPLNTPRELQLLSLKERYEWRQLRVKPVVEAFYEYLDSFIQMKGKLQIVGNYVLNQRQELMTFLKDGRLEASNNGVKRVIKIVIIG